MNLRVTPCRASSRRALWIATLGASVVLLRLAVAAHVPILDDEAYYWLWSRHLAWGYPDHPPLIAALIALSTALLGRGPLAIRILPLLLASATPVLAYLAGREMFNRPAGVRAAFLLLPLPAFMLGTVFAFPDGPMAFLWMLSLWMGWRALCRGGWWWVVTGAAIGLTFLSKEMALFLVLGLAGTALTDPERRFFRDPRWYLGLAAAAALVAPVVLWNAQHDWATARVILNRELWTAPRSVPLNLLAFTAGQVLFFGPLALLLAAAAVAAARRASTPVWRYLAWMSLPILALAVAGALGARAKPHWPAPAYSVAAIALGALWPQWARLRSVLVQSLAALTVLLTLGLSALAFLPRLADLAGGRWDLAARMVAREALSQKAFVLASNYQLASQLRYHLEEADGRILVTTPFRAFRLWNPPQGLAGRSVVYAEDRHDADRNSPPRLPLQTFCRNVRPAGRVVLAPQRVLVLYRCEDFSGSFAGLPPWGP